MYKRQRQADGDTHAGELTVGIIRSEVVVTSSGTHGTDLRMVQQGGLIPVSYTHLDKGVSARDMSLSLGQSAGYINNIENGVNLPSMAMFFYICDYLEVTPEEFFSVELADPMRLKRLNQSLRRLTGHQLELLELLVQEMK